MECFDGIDEFELSDVLCWKFKDLLDFSFMDVVFDVFLFFVDVFCGCGELVNVVVVWKFLVSEFVGLVNGVGF